METRVALIGARVLGPWACPWWHISLTEDGGCGKSYQSCPSTWLSSSEVPLLAPAELSFQKTSRRSQRRPVSWLLMNCLPNMQGLTSSSNSDLPGLGFPLFWSIRDAACCLLGVILGSSCFLAAHRGPRGIIPEMPRNAHLVPGSWGRLPHRGSC